MLVRERMHKPAVTESCLSFTPCVMIATRRETRSHRKLTLPFLHSLDIPDNEKNTFFDQTVFNGLKVGCKKTPYLTQETSQTSFSSSGTVQAGHPFSLFFSLNIPFLQLNSLTIGVKLWVIQSFLTFDSIDKILKCDHSLESCCSTLLWYCFSLLPSLKLSKICQFWTWQ